MHVDLCGPAFDVVEYTQYSEEEIPVPVQIFSTDLFKMLRSTLPRGIRG